jgi:hypothetical protein
VSAVATSFGEAVVSPPELQDVRPNAATIARGTNSVSFFIEVFFPGRLHE